MKVSLFVFFSLTPFTCLANFFSWQLTSNHELTNFLYDNPHESNSLYLALLLQKPLMAHDDGF